VAMTCPLAHTHAHQLARKNFPAALAVHCLSCMHTHSLSVSLSLTHTHAYTHTHTQSHTYSCAHTHIDTHTPGVPGALEGPVNHTSQGMLEQIVVFLKHLVLRKFLYVCVVGQHDAQLIETYMHT